MPAQTTDPPGASARSATGTSSPAGAKMIAASSCSGSWSAVPAHSAPSPRANAIRVGIGGAPDREHAPALVRGDLADQVGRGAEPVEPEPLRVAAHAQRPVADHPRAEKRRGLGPGVGGQRQAEALVGGDQLGVAAVAGVAGEDRPRAEVLASRGAVAALAAGPAEPRDPDPVAGSEALRPGPRPDHLGDHLMAEDQRQLRLGQFGVDDVEVGAADAAGDHPREQLAAPRLRIGDLGLHERLPGTLEDDRPHACLSTSRRSRTGSSAAPGCGRRAAPRRSGPTARA